MRFPVSGPEPPGRRNLRDTPANGDVRPCRTRREAACTPSYGPDAPARTEPRSAPYGPLRHGDTGKALTDTGNGFRFRPASAISPIPPRPSAPARNGKGSRYASSRSARQRASSSSITTSPADMRPQVADSARHCASTAGGSPSGQGTIFGLTGASSHRGMLRLSRAMTYEASMIVPPSDPHPPTPPRTPFAAFRDGAIHYRIAAPVARTAPAVSRRLRDPVRRRRVFHGPRSLRPRGPPEAPPFPATSGPSRRPAVPHVAPA